MKDCSRLCARSKAVLGHSNIVRETPRRAIVSLRRSVPDNEKAVRELTGTLVVAKQNVRKGDIVFAAVHYLQDYYLEARSIIQYE